MKVGHLHVVDKNIQLQEGYLSYLRSIILLQCVESTSSLSMRYWWSLNFALFGEAELWLRFNAFLILPLSPFSYPLVRLRTAPLNRVCLIWVNFRSNISLHSPWIQPTLFQFSLDFILFHFIYFSVWKWYFPEHWMIIEGSFPVLRTFIFTPSNIKKSFRHFFLVFKLTADRIVFRSRKIKPLPVSF